MLLVVDVGNTAITLGVYEGDKLRATWNLATGLHRMVDEYASQLLFLMDHEGIKPTDLRGIALCTVVPPLSRVFKEMFRRYFKLTPLIVAAGTRTGIKIRMDNPREVGADRVVNAVAAHHLYGGPVIVCDFGTATTFDTVSADGEYIGGAIAPGLLTSAEALYNRAASLPRVELERPKRAIGTNTVDAMRSALNRIHMDATVRILGQHVGQIGVSLLLGLFEFFLQRTKRGLVERLTVAGVATEDLPLPFDHLGDRCLDAGHLIVGQAE